MAVDNTTTPYAPEGEQQGFLERWNGICGSVMSREV